VVPADHKSVSGIATATILLHALETLDPKLPTPTTGLDGFVIR